MVKHLCYLLFVVSTLFTSCIKEEIGDFEDLGFYKPEFSFPLGEPSILMNSFLESIDLSTKVIPDSLINDTLEYFVFDNEYYDVPDILYYDFTEAFSLSSYTEELDQISSLMFRTNAVNRIPAEIQIQVYFLAANYAIIDSLYNERLIIQPANTDTEGNLISQSELWKYDTELSQEKIQALAETSYIMVSSQLKITNTSGVINNYYSEQDIWIQLGMRIGLKVEL